MNLRLRLASVGFIAAVLCGLLLPVFAGTGELFRYRLRTKDGRQFEYVFESSAEPSASSITREEATRIAADWMPTFYHLQLGSIEYAEFYEKPLPHWLVCFADTASGHALHCQKATARAIVEKGGDYVLQVKANQPSILEQAKTLTANNTPLLSTSKKLTADSKNAV